MRILSLIKNAINKHRYITLLLIIGIIGSGSAAAIAHIPDHVSSWTRPQTKTTLNDPQTPVSTGPTANTPSTSGPISSDSPPASTPNSPPANSPASTPSSTPKPVDNSAQCANLNSQEQSQIASLDSQIKQDNTNMAGEQAFMNSYTTYGPTVSGISPEQYAAAQAAWQNNKNQVDSDFAQISSIQNQYNSQLYSLGC